MNMSLGPTQVPQTLLVREKVIRLLSRDLSPTEQYAPSPPRLTLLLPRARPSGKFHTKSSLNLPRDALEEPSTRNNVLVKRPSKLPTSLLHSGEATRNIRCSKDAKAQREKIHSITVLQHPTSSHYCDHRVAYLVSVPAQSHG